VFSFSPAIHGADQVQFVLYRVVVYYVVTDARSRFLCYI